MDYVTIIGFIAAGLTIATLSMRTMVPLRMVGIAANIAFLAYGFLFGSLPTVVLHGILLPLNIYRLAEMRKLIASVKAASSGDLNMDWIKPFMHKRAMAAGEVLFRKGDEADRLFFVVSGKLRLHEIDIELAPGAIVGELGMLAPGRRRTQTLECTESGTLLEIGYDKIEELYYQNPTFGFYFLRLSSARLFENIERANKLLAERDEELFRLRGSRAAAG
ncbi:MAG: cyclic nucleotide-binding domain-containing protein [Bradyrhizobiaceae bacterium]|nr:cyclic nucleotide-binding domain-containing protein [Bradyrhizobiaceae bacterium]